MTHTHAKDQAQRSVSSKDRVGMGRGYCIICRANAVGNYWHMQLLTAQQN